MCAGAVFVVCGAVVFGDGAMRALPRAAARAQSSAEAVVLAMLRWCACAAFRVLCALLALVALCCGGVAVAFSRA